MQLFGNFSEEGNTEGFGWIDGDVIKFENEKLKIPHVGFNNVNFQKSLLFKGIPQFSDFYFVHSYYFKLNSIENKVSHTFYGKNFISTVNKQNIFGVQFHPEKSQKNGLKLLLNFNLI